MQEVCVYEKIKEQDEFGQTIHTSCGYMVTENEANESICPFCGKVIYYGKKG